MTGIGIVFSWRITSPIHALAEVTRRVAGGDYGRRVRIRSNDEIGYLCTDRSYVEGGYEPGAYVYYGRPAPFKGEEALIVETAARLLHEA